MSPAPALIFDLDGSLIDSLPDLAAAVNRMLATEGRQPMAPDQVRSFVGDGAKILVARVMAERGIDMARHDALAGRLVADYTERSAELTTVYPHVHETLETLRSDGHRLGICTNKPAAATASVLDALGLAPFFDCVIAGDTLAERKPHPAPLRAASAALGVHGLFIGDSEVDARTAEAAGLPFLLFSAGYLRVPRSEIHFTGVFDDFRDLPQLVARVRALT
ncbi:phosphoglycolate phosphatase [Defluviimonas sp. D31]|uniref:phosphoglycolate phosphatase n=1 Tax=Defluviimonas sp. D31 TaxID=3083253 RepID=UPI00296E4FB8|nr:phosphoglycolate phosphatase [Defluviimonas sp. D31]MDW4547756.1 phosphoglycolate phosphatase [Defluviimonas sp. D31]